MYVQGSSIIGARGRHLQRTFARCVELNVVDLFVHCAHFELYLLQSSRAPQLLQHVLLYGGTHVRTGRQVAASCG